MLLSTATSLTSPDGEETDISSIGLHLHLSRYFSVGWTALHEACYYNSYDAAKLLLEHGAFASVEGPDKETPLHDAASKGFTEVCIVFESVILDILFA